MTTARDVITRSLQFIGAITRFDTLKAGEAEDALDDLNNMLASWSNTSLLSYYRVTESFALTPGDGEYTIGPSGDFNTARPISLISAYVRDGISDINIDFMTDQEYASINEKTLQGVPSYINFDNASPLATIKIYPIPDSAYTLYLLSEKKLSALTLDADIELPPGWILAMQSNLAMILAPQYGQPVSGELARLATESLGSIKTAVATTRAMDATNQTFVKVNSPYVDARIV